MTMSNQRDGRRTLKRKFQRHWSTISFHLKKKILRASPFWKVFFPPHLLSSWQHLGPCKVDAANGNNLKWRGISSSNMSDFCSLCKVKIKSVDHLLFHRSLSKDLASHVTQVWGYVVLSRIGLGTNQREFLSESTYRTTPFLILLFYYYFLVGRWVGRGSVGELLRRVVGTLGS